MKRSIFAAVLGTSLLFASLAHADSAYVPIGDPYTDTIGLWGEIASGLASLANDFVALFNVTNLAINYREFTPQTGARLQAAAVVPTESSQQSSPSITYTVKPGDTLSGVAKSYGISLTSLFAENDLSHDAILHPGETLIIPDPQIAPATSSETASNTTPGQTTLSHNVKSPALAPAQSSSANPTNVIEAEPAFNSTFVTQSELAQVLLALSPATSNKPAPTSAPLIPLADGNPTIPYAAENNITNLSNVTITNANLSASEIPDLSGSYLSLNGGAVSGTTTIATALGIGTTTPWQMLSVGGNFSLTGAFYDNNASPGLHGYVLQSTGSGVNWVATSTLGFGGSSQWATNGANISYSTGNVGIGTTSPFAALSVNGAGYFSSLNLGSSSQSPTAAPEWQSQASPASR